jgi:hypothetical protein
MKTYRIAFALKPTNYNTARVLFVEAANEYDAEKVAKEFVERKEGIASSEFLWQHIGEVTSPSTPGRVLG